MSEIRLYGPSWGGGVLEFLAPSFEARRQAPPLRWDAGLSLTRVSTSISKPLSSSPAPSSGTPVERLALPRGSFPLLSIRLWITEWRWSACDPASPTQHTVGHTSEKVLSQLISSLLLELPMRVICIICVWSREIMISGKRTLFSGKRTLPLSEVFFFLFLFEN